MMYDDLEHSYTWKDEYCIPYETEWARIAKFSFLNGMSWFNVKKNSYLKKQICFDSSPPFYHRIPNNKFDKFKICPECMKYGYQSYLHLINEFDFCFLHKCALIEISAEQVEASKYGTYEFIKIRTEDIVQNRHLTRQLNTYIKRREEEKILDINYFCFLPNNRTCYKSTNTIYLKYYFLQDDLECINAKCIYSVNYENIDEENRTLAKNIILRHAANEWLYDDIYWKNRFNKFEDVYMYCKNMFLSNDDTTLKFPSDVLGWCFMKIISDIIEKIFDGYEDWNDTVNLLNGSYRYASMSKENIHKYALIMAFQTITAVASAGNAFKIDSNYWARNSYTRNFGLDVLWELGNYRGSYLVNTKLDKKATQYIVYPILKDLFMILAKQAYDLFDKEIVTLEPEKIDRLSIDIWHVPQYVVLFYENKTVIYRCEAD